MRRQPPIWRTIKSVSSVEPESATRISSAIGRTDSTQARMFRPSSLQGMRTVSCGLREFTLEEGRKWEVGALVRHMLLYQLRSSIFRVPSSEFQVPASSCGSDLGRLGGALAPLWRTTNGFWAR